MTAPKYVTAEELAKRLDYAAVDTERLDKLERLVSCANVIWRASCSRSRRMADDPLLRGALA